MFKTESKMLQDAKAGNYKPKIHGFIKFPLYFRSLSREQTSLEQVIELVDISFYQVYANFNTMLFNGVKGAIIRAGQNLWPDSRAEVFMSDAENSKMPVGSYWFYDSRADPKEQAKLWKRVLGTHKTPLKCWADYEENYNSTYKGWKHFYDFLEACKAEMPDREFGIYTGYYYWIEHSPNPITQAASLAYFSGYPLWLAWYTNDISLVRIPRPWTKMLFWQFTSSGDGIKYGVGSREIDKNLFMGTFEEYKQMVGETGGEMPDITFEGEVKPGTNVVVRSAPAGVDTLRRLSGGTAIKGVGTLVPATLNGILYNWMNIVLPVEGWVAENLLIYNPVNPTPTSHKLEVIIDGVVEFTKEF